MGLEPQFTLLPGGVVTLTGPHRSDPTLRGTRGQHRFAIGLDLGSSTAGDPSALAVIEDKRLPLPEYDRGGQQLLGDRSLRVVHLERLQGEAYTAIARHAAATMLRPPLSGRATLTIDATGPGRPFCDILREMKIEFTGVQMTSGQGVNRGEGGLLNVGKSKLLYDLAGALETGQLTIANGMSLAQELLRELSEFRVEQSAAGNLLIDVRSADHHGDLTVAVALALFTCNQSKGFCGEGKLAGYY